MRRVYRIISIARTEGLRKLLKTSSRAAVNQLAYYYGTVVRRNLAGVVDSHVDNPYRTIAVDPDTIHSAGGFFNPNPARYGGSYSLAYYSGATVKGGDWDLDAISLENLPKFQAVQRRFGNGESWEETGIYGYMKRKIEEEGSYDGCLDQEDVLERYREIDRLYESMRDEGYVEEKCGTLDHICVNVGRGGEILFNGNGQHRLAISKALNLDEITVRVLVRHKQWAEIRSNVMDRLIKPNTTNPNSDVYIDHPDINVDSVEEGV